MKLTHINCNYHTHTVLCRHAKGMPIDYVKKAILLGMSELGFADHGYVPRSFFPRKEQDNTPVRMTEEEFYDVYIPAIDECKKQFSSSIKVFSGLECEYFNEQYDYYKNLKDHLDYLVFGQHFFVHEGKLYNVYNDMDSNSILLYAKYACEALDSRLFTVFAHPDVFMMRYKDENGNREFDKNAELATRKMIESAIKNDVYLEININGVGNSKQVDPVIWAYPNEKFWKIVKEYPKAKIIYGMDAHWPDFLENEHVEKVLEFVKRLGLNVDERLKY